LKPPYTFNLLAAAALAGDPARFRLRGPSDEERAARASAEAFVLEARATAERKRVERAERQRAKARR
jgi:hypothetical protein